MTELDLIGTKIKNIDKTPLVNWFFDVSFPDKPNSVIIYLKIVIIKSDYSIRREYADLLIYCNTGIIHTVYSKFNKSSYLSYCIENKIPYEIIDKTK